MMIAARPASIRPADPKHALALHASTVCVVTAGTRRRPRAATVTSVMSLSLDPPLLAFAVPRSWGPELAWHASTRGTMHLLHDGQAVLAEACANPAVDPLDGFFPWRWDDDAGPVFADAMAWLTIVEAGPQAVGGLALMVAKVRDVRVRDDVLPLLRFDSRYLALAVE